MHILTGLRLRFWAVAQFFYSVFAGDKTFEDIRGTFRDQILCTALGGHLNDFVFSCTEDKRLLIGDPVNHRDEWYIEAFGEELRYYEKIGRKRSGLLLGYLRAQRAHLAACAGCRTHGIAVAKQEIVERKAITGMFDDFRRSDPEGFDRFVEDIRDKRRP